MSAFKNRTQNILQRALERKRRLFAHIWRFVYYLCHKRRKIISVDFSFFCRNGKRLVFASAKKQNPQNFQKSFKRARAKIFNSIKGKKILRVLFRRSACAEASAGKQAVSRWVGWRAARATSHQSEFLL